MSTGIACVFVPDLPLACALVGRPALTVKPVAIADEDRVHVVSCSAEAEQFSIRRGIPIREAVALCPTLHVLDVRPAQVARAADGLTEALATVSPLIEEAAPGEVYADVRGLDGLYPQPGTLERTILDAAPLALQPRVGIADTRFTALMAARRAAPSGSMRVEADQATAFLAPLPASWLSLETENIERLRLLGIDTIGKYAALPRNAVEAQFGQTGGRAWLAAWGKDPTLLRARPFAQERVRELIQAQPPLVSKESIVLNVEQLLSRALRHPRLRGRFVRAVRLRAVTEDDRLWERTQVLREPFSDRDRLWTVLRPLLERAEYPGPVNELELELAGLTAESGRQPGLFDAEWARRREHLDEMVRHLKVRFGRSPLARVVEVEPWSRIPERRRALMDYDP